MGVPGRSAATPSATRRLSASWRASWASLPGDRGVEDIARPRRPLQHDPCFDMDPWKGERLCGPRGCARDPRCPCCVQRRFEFLRATTRTLATFCGRDAVQISARSPARRDAPFDLKRSWSDASRRRRRRNRRPGSSARRSAPRTDRFSATGGRSFGDDRPRLARSCTLASSASDLARASFRPPPTGLSFRRSSKYPRRTPSRRTHSEPRRNRSCNNHARNCCHVARTIIPAGQPPTPYGTERFKGIDKNAFSAPRRPGRARQEQSPGGSMGTWRATRPACWRFIGHPEAAKLKKPRFEDRTAPSASTTRTGRSTRRWRRLSATAGTSVAQVFRRTRLTRPSSSVRTSAEGRFAGERFPKVGGAIGVHDRRSPDEPSSARSRGDGSWACSSAMTITAQLLPNFFLGKRGPWRSHGPPLVLYPPERGRLLPARLDRRVSASCTGTTCSRIRQDARERAHRVDLRHDVLRVQFPRHWQVLRRPPSRRRTSSFASSTRFSFLQRAYEAADHPFCPGTPRWMILSTFDVLLHDDGLFTFRGMPSSTSRSAWACRIDSTVWACMFWCHIATVASSGDEQALDEYSRKILPSFEEVSRLRKTSPQDR